MTESFATTAAESGQRAFDEEHVFTPTSAWVPAANEILRVQPFSDQNPFGGFSASNHNRIPSGEYGEGQMEGLAESSCQYYNSVR